MRNTAILEKPDINQRNAINMDDIKQIKKAFNTANHEAQQRAYDFLNLPEEVQIELLETYNKKAAIAAYTLPPLPVKGDGSYETLPPYVRMSKDELKAFVKKNWGDWLAAYNDKLDIDAISRKQLRSYDKRLITRLEKEFTTDELNEIIQTEEKKIELEVNSLSNEEIQKATRIMNFISRHKAELEAA